MYPPIDPTSNPWAYSGGGAPPLPGRQPWMMPGIYSPGQVAFNSNPGMSQLISMMSPAVLSNFAGPNTFIPHMMPTISNADQIRLSGFQRERFQAMQNVSQDNTPAVRDMMLGMSKMVSDTAANNPMVQEQANFIARIANDPAAKMIAGQLIGDDNVESLLHGSKGDISALNSKTSQMAYYMTDPSGVGRMGADAMSAYSRGVYSHLYEPDIDVKREEEAARSGDNAKRTQAKQRLQKAANTGDQILDDTEIVDRLVNDAESSKKTAELYTKYVSGGKETDARKQAEALVKYDRAIKESGVLTADEMSISQAGTAAEKSAVNKARGFLAGQVGQLTEYLQQTGQVGSSIGTKSLEERVSAVAELDVNDATFARMGRELAKKNFSDTNNQSDEAIKYRSLQTQAEREAFIRDNSAQFEQEVRNTKQQAEAAAAGGKGAPKLEDVEKLGGFQNLAVDVDADKTAKSLEGYLDAVAAVRDIFGDNGNPNAPMPALIATLNQLTGSAGAQMSGQKIATQIRQMQTAAKETGVSQAELINTSLQAQNQARALGLTDADAMRGVTGSLLARKVMTETGAFNTPSYGEYNAQQAQQMAMDFQQRGQASITNKSLTAMVAMYKNSPEAFKGTALEAAVKSYEDGTGTYVDPDTGETVNFADEVAKKGQLAVRELGERAANTGVNAGRTDEEVARARRRFASSYAINIDSVENQQYTNDTFVRRVQAENVEERANRSLVPKMTNELEELRTFERLGIAENKKAATALAISEKLEARAREAEELPEEEQAAYMRQHVEEDIQAGLVASGVDAKDAAPEAKKLATDRNAFGEGSTIVDDFRVQGRRATQGQTGQLRKNVVNKYLNKDTVDRIADKEAQSAMRAETDKALAAGFETTPAQRASDYFRSLQEGNENFTASGLMEALAPGRDYSELMRTINPDMARALEQSDARRKSAVIDAAEIETAVTAANSGDATALRKLAEVSDDTTVVSADDAMERLSASLDSKSDDDLYDLSKKYLTQTFTKEEVAKDREGIAERLMQDDAFKFNEVGAVLGEKETTVAQMKAAANKRAGKAADGLTDEESKAITKREDAIERAMLSGKDEDIQEALFQIEALAEKSMPQSTMQKMTGAQPAMTKEQRKTLNDLVGSKETKREDFEKFADELGLTGAAREEVISAAVGTKAAKDIGGVAGAYGLDGKGPAGDKKLTDAKEEGKLPPRPDKKTEKEAIAVATEAKKLEEAGVISKDGATQKTEETGGRHPHEKTVGQEEQVSVLKDILTAIRALGGTDGKPDLKESDALKIDPTKPVENSPEAKAREKTDSIVAEHIARVAVKNNKDAIEETARLEAVMPEIESAIGRARTKEDGTVDADAVHAELKKSGVRDVPDSVLSSLFTDNKGKAVKREDALALASNLRDALPAAKSALQQATVNSDGSINAVAAARAYKQLREKPEKDDRKQGALSRLYDEFVSAERPQVDVTTLGDLIKPPEKNVGVDVSAVPTGVTSVHTEAGAKSTSREFHDYPIENLNSLLQGWPHEGIESGIESIAPRYLSAGGPEFAATARRDIGGLFPPGETGATELSFGKGGGGDMRGTGGFAGGMFAQQLPNPQTTSSMLIKEDPVINPKPEPAPQQKQTMEISGRLTLDGLQEAILAAAGDTAVQTGGAPVVPG